jgi:hypothetical protein
LHPIEKSTALRRFDQKSGGGLIAKPLGAMDRNPTDQILPPIEIARPTDTFQVEYV